MAESEEDLKSLLADPHESLDLELKQWIDPSTNEGKAKIARACIALRNNNGGRLVIGFTNEGRPDVTNVPQDVRKMFHVDVVQAIVGRCSAELFGIEVSFVEREGLTYPVITVPSGVRTPVTAKTTLRSTDGKSVLIRDNAVYVRSLSSNLTVSSAEPTRSDWDRVIRICFDNREADFGGFVRRHLAALNPDILAALGPAFAGLLKPPSTADKVTEGLNRGKARFEVEAKRRKVQLASLGYHESLILIDGEAVQQNPTDFFLATLLTKAPQHTGWPPWVYLPNTPIQSYRPYVYEQGWEAFIDDLAGTAAFDASFDFWRIEPRGFFYRLRVLEDDLVKERGVEPGTRLDFLLQISRVAEVISTGLSFGRSLGCDETKTSLVFGFLWTGLADRQLTCWVEPHRSFYSRGLAVQDALTTSVVVPLETPQSGIAPHVENAVRDLFMLFGGMSFESRVIEQIVSKAIGLSR
jgi:Putative DNA-binding domain